MLVEQAKAGDVAAIAALMNRRLQPHQIQAAIVCQGDCLAVTLVAETVPDQQQMTAFVHQGLSKLRPAGINHLNLKGLAHTDAEPQWQVTLPLESAPISSVAIGSHQSLPDQFSMKRSSPAATLTSVVTTAPRAEDNVSVDSSSSSRQGQSPAKSSTPPPLTAKNWWQHASTQPYLLLGLAAAFSLLLWQTFGLVVLLLLLAVATIPARIAWGRGYHFFNWYLYSFALPVAALFHAIVVPKRGQAGDKTGGQNFNQFKAVPAVEQPVAGTSPQPESLATTNFAKQSLAGANFGGQDLTDANFEGADLSGANFSQAICTGANFSRTKLGGACFTGTNLTQANFTQATVVWQRSWVKLATQSLPIWGWVLILMVAINLFSLSMSLPQNRYADYSFGSMVLAGGWVTLVGVMAAQNPQRPNLRRNWTTAIATLVAPTSLVTVQTFPGLTASKFGLLVLAGVLALMPNAKPSIARWGTGVGVLGGLSVANLWSFLAVGGNNPQTSSLIVLHLLVLGLATITGRATAVFVNLWFVNFERAILKQTHFARANLSRANFLGASVTDVTWQQARLAGAIRPNGQRVK